MINWPLIQDPLLGELASTLNLEHPVSMGMPRWTVDVTHILALPAGFDRPLLALTDHCWL